MLYDAGLFDFDLKLEDLENEDDEVEKYSCDDYKDDEKDESKDGEKN